LKEEVNTKIKLALIFNINQTQLILENIENPEFSNLKVEDPIKPLIKNFLISGKIIKM
jgi:hypothetical protein